MSATHAMEIQWAGGNPQDRHFRRITSLVLGSVLALSAAVSLIAIEKPDRVIYQAVPERLARLVIEARKPPPPPPPRVEEAPEPEPVVPPEAQPEPQPQAQAEPAPARQAARERAERAGVMAFKDVFAELRQAPALDRLNSTTRLRSTGTEARATERSILTAGRPSGSGGIDTSGLSRDTGATALASRNTSTVEAPAAKQELEQAAERARQRIGDRSDAEIELVFDRNKSVIYNIYNRALRSNPALRGKVVFKLTINPDGQVAAIEVLSSELGDPSLERKLVLRIRRFDFGAREVAATTIRYTIDFFPS